MCLLDVVVFICLERGSSDEGLSERFVHAPMLWQRLLVGPVEVLLLNADVCQAKHCGSRPLIVHNQRWDFFLIVCSVGLEVFAPDLLDSPTFPVRKEEVAPSVAIEASALNTVDEDSLIRRDNAVLCVRDRIAQDLVAVANEKIPGLERVVDVGRVVQAEDQGPETSVVCL